MQRRNKQRRLILLVLLAATLLCGVGTVMIRRLGSTVDAAPVITTETAKSADAFVNSICVNTHWGFADTPYGSQYNAVKQKLVELGIRHVRDSGSSADVIAKMKELARLGIKTNYIINPKDGVAPNSSYWVNAPSYKINDFVKNKVGTNVIDAVEILNEIDIFYNLNGGYYWHPGDKQKLNNEPNSPFYWLSYARSVTKDTWTALKSDRATAKVKVIGPSLGITYDYSKKSPLGDLSRYVDWGNFHPYPNGGNPFSVPFSYNTIEKYYWQGNFPSVNLDEHPYAFDIYKPPFGSKPMVATETGYNTGKASKSISERMHGKYMPRLFLEYFRKGVLRTCSYDFVNDWNDPNNPEANYGLLRNDLSPKPAYTALKNLIRVLKDPGSSFTPGKLNYGLNVNPPTGYDRTQYVHHLLLQKRDGTFYLVLWHEISNGDITSTPAREIAPPAMPIKLTLKTPIARARVYSWDDMGNLSSKLVPASSPISLIVPDKVMLVQLMPRRK